MKNNTLAAVLLACLAVFGCNPRPQPTPPLVILDTDIGSSTDDLMALQMLCRYADEGRLVLLGVICDRKGANNAMMADLLLNYYGHPECPIGIERSYDGEAKVFVDYCADKGDSSMLLHHQKLGYKLSVSDASSLPDGWVLYRQLLSKAPNHSVSIVSVGFLTSLSLLLNSPADSISPLTGVELVAQKVKTIYVMGSYLSRESCCVDLDYNLSTPSADYTDSVFRLLPSGVEVVFSPSQVGQRVGRYDNDSVLADIKDHRNPIYAVYNRFHVDENQYLWDVLPVVQCIEGDDLFHLSERGRVWMSVEDGVSHLVFTPDSTGNVRFKYIPYDWSEQDSVAFRRSILNKIKETF